VATDSVIARTVPMRAHIMVIDVPNLRMKATRLVPDSAGTFWQRSCARCPAR
jgi:hypothetical protein